MPQRFSVTLTQLTYFVECAKLLNMTAASQQLHVAQSAVSTAISHLERSLNTTLFLRQHSKGLVLTPSGENLLRDTQQVFGLLNDTIESIHSDQSSVRGTISVACFSTLAPFFLPQLIDGVRSQHPELTLEIIEGDYEENLAALRGGRAEIILGYDLTDLEGIERAVIGQVRPYVLLPLDHPLAQHERVRLAELQRLPFVLLDLPDSSDYFLNLLLASGISPEITYRSSSYETVRSMVATGLGFSLLNQRPRTTHTYTGQQAKIVEIADEVPHLNITVTSLAQVRSSARARAVTRVFQEVFDEQPWNRQAHEVDDEPARQEGA